MKGALISIEGNWGHFKKPETNNNPLTHDFITKTALIGMFGAVLGIERPEMKKVFPRLSEALCYGVQIHSAVKKESWSFKLRYASDLFAKRPVQMEFLKNPRYTIAIGLRDENSADQFNQFIAALEESEARFTPVLGLHNCPANLDLIACGEFKADNGDFKTKSFITEQHKIIKVTVTDNFRIGVDRLPTYQNDDFWNLPDKYVRVFYPSEGREISASGAHHVFSDDSKWVLI
ncbi:MAG: CRISPR-associated protein Cas5h [Acidobacteriota bacterium]|jgi:CRISPR-associated protein Cas5 subtype I-B|nr:CRISPR-associated protein Cas5h [Acidobacteriota bacterium]